MTPNRKRALQWFHDRGETRYYELEYEAPSRRMVTHLLGDGLLQCNGRLYSLTDKGRRALHGDA